MITFLTVACAVFLTVVALRPKVWTCVLPPVLLPAGCLCLLLYYGAWISMHDNIDPAYGVNEYVQDRISGACGNFDRFIATANREPEKLKEEIFLNIICDDFEDEMIFRVLAAFRGPVLSEVHVYKDNKIPPDADGVRWNGKIVFSSVPSSKIVSLLFDFDRVMFFYFVLLSIIILWRSCEDRLLSGSGSVAVALRMLPVVVLCAVGLLASARIMFPAIAYHPSVRFNFGKNKLSDPKLAEDIRNILQAETPEENGQQALCERLGVDNVFLASDKSLRVPHVRWNGSFFEYRFFIPEGYSPHELNPRLTWDELGNGFWHAKYRSFFIAFWINQIILCGLYLMSWMTVAYFVWQYGRKYDELKRE